jgi:zinc transport system substrate-binding protein
MRNFIIAILTSAAMPVFAEVPRVVTDIPPVHAIVAQVMGDLGMPTLLLTKGADEHDFALSPSQARAVAKAELVVWIGPELSPWLDRALAASGDSSATVTLMGAEGTVTRAYRAEAEHDHQAEEGGHDAHDHEGVDPHVWLDPVNAERWLPLIAEQLSRLDPHNAATYAANAATVADDIRTLDAEVAAILAPAKDKPIVLFHDAYGYFADHYGLTIAGTVALGDATSPGALRLSELRGRMEGGEVLCVFPEVQHDPALVVQMAEGTGVRIGGALDPVGSSLNAGPGAYAALMRGIAQTIADCAGD